MGRMRFVQPLTVTLELSDGDTIEVKQRLTYGEEQQLANASIIGTVNDAMKPDIKLDMSRYGMRRMAMWLVDWSFVGPDGKVMPITEQTLASLDSDTAKEIDDALDAHIARMDEEKKVKAK